MFLLIVCRMVSDMAGSRTMRGMGPFAILGLAVIIVIVALGAYAWLTLSKYVHTGGLQVYRPVSVNRTGTLSQVMQNMTEGFGGEQFQVSYSGNATVSVGSIELTLPLNVSIARYYNDSRAEIKVQNIPLIGNVSSVQIKDGNNYYSCWRGVNSSQKGYQCSAQPESNSVFSVLNFSPSGIAPGGLGLAQVSFGTVNQSSHGGTPCTNMDGYFSYGNSTELNSLNLSQRIGQQVTEANVTFLSCVSNQDRIPLTLHAYLVASGKNMSASAALQLMETHYSRNSSAAIAALPGPLSNGTG